MKKILFLLLLLNINTITLGENKSDLFNGIDKNDLISRVKILLLADLISRHHAPSDSTIHCLINNPDSSMVFTKLESSWHFKASFRYNYYFFRGFWNTSFNPLCNNNDNHNSNITYLVREPDGGALLDGVSFTIGIKHVKSAGVNMFYIYKIDGFLTSESDLNEILKDVLDTERKWLQRIRIKRMGVKIEGIDLLEEL